MTPRDAAQWVLTEEINAHGPPLDWRAVDRVVKKVMEVSGCSFDTAKEAMQALIKEKPSTYLAYPKSPKVVKAKKRAPKKKAKRRRKIS